MHWIWSYFLCCFIYYSIPINCSSPSSASSSPITDDSLNNLDDNIDEIDPVTEKISPIDSANSDEGRKPYWTKVDRMQKKLHAEPAGNTVRFRCPVDGNPTPRVVWFKDGEIIKKDSRIGGFKYRSNGQMIILETVVPADQGMYMCKASNKYGSINHTYELDVQERTASSPLIPSGILNNQTVYVGDDVTFKCKVFSDAHPHIEWIKSWNVGNKTEIKVLKRVEGKKHHVLDLFRTPLMRVVSFHMIYLWFSASMVFYGLVLNVSSLVAMNEASRWISICGKMFATTAFSVAYQYTAELYPTVARGTSISMGSMCSRIGSIIMPFTLQLQEAIPWLTQAIFGSLAAIAGATSLMLPETSDADLMTSVKQAEEFYRENMPFTAKLLGKSVEKSDNINRDSEEISGYEANYDEGKMYNHSSKL